MIKYNINESFFKEWSYPMAYTLGFWYADGNMNSLDKTQGKRISFSSQDKDILIKIRELMKSNHPIYKDSKWNCYNLIISRKQLWDDIFKLGGRPAKSLVNKFPVIPNRYKSTFIRGYFDGDGSIYLSKTNYPTVCFTGCKLFLSAISKYFSNIQNSLTKKSNSPIYDLRYRGINAQLILRKLYDNSNSLYLKRKYDSALYGLSWDGCRNIEWSDEDISTLLYLKNIGISNSNMAYILNRSYGSISTELYRL